MEFTKMHGCGNDYVYVNLFEEKLDDPARVSIYVSDRHFGIGSDGLITIGPSDKADFRMRIYNADGSEAEMCGNGIRCVAKYVYDHKLTDKTEISVETGAGIKYLTLYVEENKVSQVRVDMGEPILTPGDIPVVKADGSAYGDDYRVIDEPISAGNREWHMTCVSMGNPHAVVFVDDVAGFELEKYGPLFENHKMFPKRTNTEFVEILSRNEAKMRVWERGSAETWACGTGTCATVMACILNKKTDNKVLVHPEDDWSSSIDTGDVKRNLIHHEEDEHGNVEKILSECDEIIEHTYRIKAAQQAYMETCRAYCEIDRYGRLHCISSTQIVFHLRRILANALDIPKSMVRAEKPRIGGGFGAKQTAVCEVYPAFVTWKTKRPSKIIYSRKECQTIASPRHEMEVTVRLGAMKDGHIRAIDLYTLSNGGAYGEHSTTTVGLSGHKSLPLYTGGCEATRFSCDVVYTNVQAAGAYRGYGATQGIFALESTVSCI